MRTLTVALSVSLVLISISPCYSQVRYTDEQGVAHWVETQGQVPDRYKTGATKPALPDVDGGASGDPAAQARRRLALSKGLEQHNWVRAVESCVASTQKQYHTFNAYVSAPGKAEMVGNSEARFAFKSCMTAKGHQLK